MYVMIEVNTVLHFILTRSLLSTFFWNVWLWSVSQPRKLRLYGHHCQNLRFHAWYTDIIHAWF